MKKYLIIIITILLIYIISISVKPICISSDPGWGFYTLKSMQKGAPFNHSFSPDCKDISKDLTSLSSWWTPGQYLIPGIFQYVFKTNIGYSIIFTVILFSILGIVGFYYLFIIYELDKKIAMLSIIVILLQRYYSFAFTIYNGGEVLLFGALPWILILFEKFSNLKFYQIIVIILISIFGFFLKSSFFIIFVTLILFLFAQKNIFQIIELKDITKDNILKKIINKKTFFYYAKLIFLALSTFSILYYFFIRHGNPSNTNKFSFELMDILVPISSPIVSAFSIDDLLVRIFDFPGYHSISTIHANPIYFFIPLAIINIIFYILVFKKFKFSRYMLLVICFIIVYTLIFFYFYFFDAAISYEFRHFRILGLLIIPYFISLGLNYKYKIVRYSMIVFVFVISIYGIASFTQRKHNIIKNYVIGSEYFYQNNIDKHTLNIMKKLDDSLKIGNNLFYFTSPEVSLEINNNRVMSSHADFQTLSSLQNAEYLGTVDNLYLILRTKFEKEGKEKAIKEAFVDYKKFILISETNDFKILKGIPKIE